MPPTNVSSITLPQFKSIFPNKCLEGNISLEPEEWGWKESDGQLLPVTTDPPPAPSKLIELFRCDCESGCKTMRCTCRKNGLECTSACGICKELDCKNLPMIHTDIDADEVSNE